MSNKKAIQSRKKKRKPKKGCVYILKCEDLFKVGFTSLDPKKRLNYWKKRLNTDFNLYAITEELIDGFKTESDLIWSLRGKHCYILEYNGLNTCELFFEADGHIKEFMNKKNIDYTVTEG